MLLDKVDPRHPAGLGVDLDAAQVEPEPRRAADVTVRRRPGALPLDACRPLEAMLGALGGARVGEVARGPRGDHTDHRTVDVRVVLGQPRQDRVEGAVRLGRGGARVRVLRSRARGP